MLDGHARVKEALSRNDNQLIPYVEVDVTEAEEHLILATFDPITGLASHNRDALDLLLNSVQTDDLALQSLMHDLAASIGLLEANKIEDVWQEMPEFIQNDATYRSIIIHFENQEDLDRFSRVVEQTITNKTKFIWYPYKPPMKFSSNSIIETTNTNEP